MKIIALSDTHCSHRDIQIPPCDLLIHAGDACAYGKDQELDDFYYWFREQKATYKIYVPGNHDHAAQKRAESIASRMDGDYQLEHGIYTIYNGSVKLPNGLIVAGTSWTPYFYDWAFNGTDRLANDVQATEKGPNLDRLFNRLPGNVHLFVSHGPPWGILDKNREGENCGGQMLLYHTMRMRPLMHIFGHIHESHGVTEKRGCKFFNVASMDREYRLRENPYTEIPFKGIPISLS